MAVVASKATFRGSQEHKDYPSPLGPPGLKPGKYRCDPSFLNRFEELNDWLRQSIREGIVGGPDPWEGGYPRYVWRRVEGKVYQARLFDQGHGYYKGWELEDPRDWPEAFR